MNHFDRNLDDSVLLQASRPIPRARALAIAATLTVGLVTLGYVMVSRDAGKKKKDRAPTSVPPAAATDGR